MDEKLLMKRERLDDGWLAVELATAHRAAHLAQIPHYPPYLWIAVQIDFEAGKD